MLISDARGEKMAVLLPGVPRVVSIAVNIRAGFKEEASIDMIRRYILRLKSSRLNRLKQHQYGCSGLEVVHTLVWVYEDQLDAIRPVWNSLEEHYGFELKEMIRHAGFGADFQEIEDYSRQALASEKGTILITDVDCMASSSITNGFRIVPEAHCAEVSNLIRALTRSGFILQEYSNKAA